MLTIADVGFWQDALVFIGEVLESPVFSTLLGGALAIAAGRISSRSDRQRAESWEKHRRLSDCLSSFFAQYVEYLVNPTLQSKGQLLHALTVAQMLSEGSLADLFKRFEKTLLHTAPDNAASALAPILSEIRVEAKEVLKLLAEKASGATGRRRSRRQQKS